MIVCVMSDQTVQRPPVIADGCVTQSVMVSVCDTQGTSGPKSLRLGRRKKKRNFGNKFKSQFRFPSPSLLDVGTFSSLITF